MIIPSFFASQMDSHSFLRFWMLLDQLFLHPQMDSHSLPCVRHFFFHPQMDSYSILSFIVWLNQVFLYPQMDSHSFQGFLCYQTIFFCIFKWTPFLSQAYFPVRPAFSASSNGLPFFPRHNIFVEPTFFACSNGLPFFPMLILLSNQSFYIIKWTPFLS